MYLSGAAIEDSVDRTNDGRLEKKSRDIEAV